MKLVAFQLDVGGLIWVNPAFVTSVQRQGPGIVLVRFAAGQPQQAVHVKGEPADVAGRLMDLQEASAFDRREAFAPDSPTGPGLDFGSSDLDYVRDRLRP